jgi:phosphate transport system permease protein
MIRALSPPAIGRRGIDGFRLAIGVLSIAAPAVVVMIATILARQGWPAISRFGPAFLWTTSWNPVTESFGALPFIAGTIFTSAIALALALPVGVFVAIFLAEGSAGGLRGAIGTAVELLAAIPSVVYGLWALFVMAPFLYLHFELPVSERFGSLPPLAGPPRQTSLLSASVVLAVMILPTLAAVSRDVIRAVPGGLREASHALGATWWEATWKVVLPSARAGIFGATVLALGRALGETIAVTMVIGNRPDIPGSLFSPAYTLASVVANEFTEATGQIYSTALIELGLILMLVTLAVNLGALLLVRPAVAPRP